MQKLNKLEFTTNQDLINQLKGIDVNLPLRTEGRKKEHVEIGSITRLLATLPNYQKVSFPFSLIHRNRPDFLINSEHSTIGIEVTESIPEKYAEFCALAEVEFPDVVFDIGHFRWDMEYLSKSEMRDILFTPRSNPPPWSGDSAEREWALFIKKSIDAKLVKLANEGFDKFNQNWLSIFDNLPKPKINLEKAIRFLKELLKDCWKTTPSFDAIFIEHGSVIVKITANSSNYLILNDIW